MTDVAAPEPRSAETIAGDSTPPTTVLAWEAARAALAEAQFSWLATTHPSGRPHVRPVLTVWWEGALFTTSAPAARKARNLAGEARCSVTVRTADLDVVLEGTATRVVDPGMLQSVRDAYEAKYGWPPVVRDGAFDAPYGAPTAGPPPYHLFRVEPEVVFAFGTADATAPRSTRWRFGGR